MWKRLGVVVMVAGLLFGVGAVPAFAATASGSPTEVQAKVNANKAGAEQLAALPGIGEVTAKAILDFRQMNGPFRNAEDLLQVKGIGEKKVEALRGLVTFE